MANNINSGSGSIYFRNDRKKWMARYWEYDVMKDRNVKKKKRKGLPSLFFYQNT